MNTTSSTYTSAATGITYTVKRANLRRMAGGLLDGGELREVEYTEYYIFRDGQLVQFCFIEGDIPETVARYENPGPDLGSRFD